jgi:sigma-B regulation protein RsbU (phosphoserine phosphatase)
MSIRKKLLILLLLVSLAPLIIASLLHRYWTHSLGNHLAGEVRETLTQSARLQLQQLVDGYGQILNRNKELLVLSLKMQAEAAERRLSEGPPGSPRLFFSRDYDVGINLPGGMVLSDKHYREVDGKLNPIPVTYEEQVYFVPAGVDPETIADDLACLSTMPEVYQFIYKSNPDMMYWQYTALESGFHTCYPGHGGYPANYDPRKRRWYVEAKEADSLVWFPPMIEVSTRTITLALSMPVHRPNGAFAGVTAIDIPLAGIFKPLQLPEQWASGAESMVVNLAMTGEAAGKKLAIVAGKSYEGRISDWHQPVALEYLESNDQQELAVLMKEALAGRAGVRRMSYQGRDAFWAYGGGGKTQTFPVVIVPYELIVAKAAEAEKAVRRETIDGLIFTGIILLAVLGATVAVAFYSSCRVSKPIVQVTEAGRKLAGGNYSATVNIKTGDELEELGNVFNSTGPKLLERERMKQSLALAMEIQQHRLPQEAPRLEGFETAGRSIYCDETGGDYYDFIDLVDLGSGKLGVAVGDVTGHGIGAALLMVSARGALRSHAGSHGGDLTELFRIVNAHLVRDTGNERFMTLFYGMLDSATSTLRWTSAGHDPAMWLRRGTGQIEELSNTGIPLGVLEETTYEPAGPVSLQSGDIVLIGTDGIWEARNPTGEQFGKHRLRELLSSHSSRTAAEIRGAVAEAVYEFIGTGSQEDDITLVVIKKL